MIFIGTCLTNDRKIWFLVEGGMGDEVFQNRVFLSQQLIWHDLPKTVTKKYFVVLVFYLINIEDSHHHFNYILGIRLQQFYY